MPFCSIMNFQGCPQPTFSHTRYTTSKFEYVQFFPYNILQFQIASTYSLLAAKGSAMSGSLLVFNFLSHLGGNTVFFCWNEESQTAIIAISYAFRPEDEFTVLHTTVKFESMYEEATFFKEFCQPGRKIRLQPH